MNIDQIKRFPTEFLDQKKGRCHESILRSWQILNAVKAMLKREDSAETILAIIEYIENQPESSTLSNDHPITKD